MVVRPVVVRLIVVRPKVVRPVVVRLCAVLVVTACVVACSAPSGPAPQKSPLVRASSSPPETVVVEKADLYRAREVAGVVERRPERVVRSPWSGTFTPARGLGRGSTVGKGATVGVIRTCAMPGPAAAVSSGATADTGGAPAPSGASTGTGTDAGTATGTGLEAATATCAPRWHAVRAPVGGSVTALPGSGAQTTEGAAVLRIRPPGYVIRATVTDPAALYDLMRPPQTARSRIVGGPAGFTVRFERRTYDPADGSVVLVLAVPADIVVVEGLHTSTAFVVSRRTDVPTLPVTAVQGTTGSGRVVVVDGDRPVVTSVRLGQHDGSRVEVRGLPAAARVLRFPLASDFLAAP
ncbi:hypothetical protein GCM10009845_37630 [Pedococcus bigeumensis]